MDLDRTSQAGPVNPAKRGSFSLTKHDALSSLCIGFTPKLEIAGPSSAKQYRGSGNTVDIGYKRAFSFNSISAGLCCDEFMRWIGWSQASKSSPVAYLSHAISCYCSLPAHCLRSICWDYESWFLSVPFYEILMVPRSMDVPSRELIDGSG